MNISGINGVSSNINFSNYQLNNNDNTFIGYLDKALQEVNLEQKDAYNAMAEVSEGQISVQEAVQRITQAELSLKLALEVKNKLVGSYKEVIKMQI